MSGPKISVYSLTGRAKTIVFGQIRCEQQSLACAAQTQAVLKSLSSFSGNFDQQLRNIQLLIKRTGTGQEQIKKINYLQETFKREVEEIKRELSSNMPAISPKYRITEEAYSEKQAELKKLQTLQKRAEKLKRSLDDVFRNDKAAISKIRSGIAHDLSDPDAGTSKGPDQSFLSRDNDQNIRKIEKSIVNDLNGIYSFDFGDELDAQDTSFIDRKYALNRELSELLRDDSLPQEIVEDIKQAIFKLQAITEMQNLTTFDAITVIGLGKRIDAYKQKAEQETAAIKGLMSRYAALCTMAGEEVKEWQPHKKEIQPAIEAEIARLETSLVRQQEQAYISECVDRVMEEMGYDLIGTREVKKRSGKRFRNELFTFNEGTAVNVTFSSDGQISMELGGLAREDRIPTEEESEVLRQDMESFCGEFAEFERRLRAHGIVVGDRIALTPPSAEYAAIINVNDYTIEASTQISEMNAKEKRRKAADKKVMRRNV